MIYWDMIKAVVSDKNMPANYGWRIRKVWYKAKAIICILAGRVRDSTDYDPDTVSVALMNFHLGKHAEYGTYQTWDVVCVSTRRWMVYIEQDATI